MAVLQGDPEGALRCGRHAPRRHDIGGFLWQRRWGVRQMDLHWSDLDLDLTKDGFKDMLGRRERPAL